MSDSAAAAPTASSILVKLPVPLAGSMLLTETFRAAGRGAMILDSDSAGSAKPSAPRGEAEGASGAGDHGRAPRP